MKNLFLLSLLVFGLIPNAFSQIEELRMKRDKIYKWIPFCPDGTQGHGVCPFDDMTIFSGMSCLSGELERCEDVRKAQGPDGRWWRSPARIGDDTQVNTFSRDQAKGALAYLVATKDISAAKRWQKFLESNHLKMCRKTTDNRCDITLGTSQLFGAVWSYLGLRPANWMNQGIAISRYYNPIEALVQPRDFPMHLTAADAWIRREIQRRGGPRAEKVDKKVVKILAKREPTNPYFLMLHEGPTKRVADLIMQKCPDTKPEGFERLDWSWQRGQKSRPWLHASGHDCIYIINLYERELSLK